MAECVINRGFFKKVWLKLSADGNEGKEYEDADWFVGLQKLTKLCKI